MKTLYVSNHHSLICVQGGAMTLHSIHVAPPINYCCKKANNILKHFGSFMAVLEAEAH